MAPGKRHRNAVASAVGYPVRSCRLGSENAVCLANSSFHKGQRMSSLEGTKVAAAILVALIAGMVTNLVAEELVPQAKLEENAYPIAGAEAASAPADAATPEASGKPAPLPAELLAKADVAAGELLAKKCAACHTFGSGEPNR